MFEDGLVHLELLDEVEVGSLLVHMSLYNALHALLLQPIRHVIECILVRDGIQCLKKPLYFIQYPKKSKTYYFGEGLKGNIPNKNRSREV